MVCWDEGTIARGFSHLRREARTKPALLLKLLFLALLYTIQNNILLLAAGYIDAGKYTILRQLKIIITALLWVIFMKSGLSKRKWFSLFLLLFAVILVQTTGEKERGENEIAGRSRSGGEMVGDGEAGSSNFMLGATLVIISCITSGEYYKSSLSI